MQPQRSAITANHILENKDMAEKVPNSLLMTLPPRTLRYCSIYIRTCLWSRFL